MGPIQNIVCVFIYIYIYMALKGFYSSNAAATRGKHLDYFVEAPLIRIHALEYSKSEALKLKPPKQKSWNCNLFEP